MKKKVLSSSKKSDLYIDILGTSLFISAEEEPVYLQGLLANYRTAVEHIQKSYGLRDPLKTAVLTGFLLCDEIQRMYNREMAKEEARAYETREAEKIARDLIDRLDKILEYKA
ncbi:MAG: cell division protein ZapA [Treponema sp.]|jgi:cell division protein ZapA (FtsZ GTPase activity inhibitor)|nr:cell division protein ZapA [Treponema sp.]